MPERMLEPRFTDAGQVVAINLREAVTIEGRDFFGRKAWLKFEPHNFHGWHRGPNDNIAFDWLLNTEISHNRVTSRYRRLCLEDTRGDIWLNHPEHITVLRLLGLDKISISCWPRNWPPYLLAGELWRKLSPYLEYAEYPLEWDCRSSYGMGVSTKRRRGETFIDSYDKNVGIEIFSIIDYGREIYFTSSFNYNAGYSWEKLHKILSSPTQGRQSRILYALSCLATSMGWPHQERICWPQGQAEPIVAEMFSNHRILDILGFLGAVSLTGKQLISCQVTSDRGGHLSDVRAFKNLI